MTSEASEVMLVDDDAQVRQALRWLIESIGVKVSEYESAEQFLESYSPETLGCLVLDVRMRGMSGLQLLEELRRRDISLPTVVLTGHASVPMAVKAMKLGVVEFIEKPFADDDLLDAIQEGLRMSLHLQHDNNERAQLAAKFNALSTRERQVLDAVVEGQANKVIAADLGISEKTVEAHRKRTMEKTGARVVAELIKMAIAHASYTGKP